MALSPSSTATLEQRWYVHRVNKTLLVMEVEVLAVEGGGGAGEAPDAVTVGLVLHTVGNETDGLFTGDVAWSESACSAATSAGSAAAAGAPPSWCLAGVTKQAEDGTVPGRLHVAYVRTPVPRALTLAVGQAGTAYFFGVVESTVTDGTAAPTQPKSTPLQRALAKFSAASGLTASAKAELLPAHQAAWRRLWSTATIEVDTPNTALKLAINSTLYAIFTLHDDSDFQPYPGTPLDGVTLGAFGHWGGCYLWDADMWMMPAVAPFRPDFARKLLQYRADRLGPARAQAAANGHKGAKFPWQSCASGLEVCSGNGNITALGYEEIHIGGDIVFEASQYVAKIRQVNPDCGRLP